MSHASGHPSGYEKRDINVRKTIIFSLISIAVIVAFIFLLDDFFIYQKERLYREMALEPENEELLKLRAKEDSLLSSYGISDTAAGEYYIPVDSAMELMAAESGN